MDYLFYSYLATFLILHIIAVLSNPLDHKQYEKFIMYSLIPFMNMWLLLMIVVEFIKIKGKL